MERWHIARQIRPWLIALAVHLMSLVVVLVVWWGMVNAPDASASTHVATLTQLPTLQREYQPIQPPRRYRPDSGTAVRFFGVERHARRIVFLVDASGSMAPRLDYITSELRRSIYDLSHEQRVTVLFYQQYQLIKPQFSDDGYAAVDPLLDWLRMDTLPVVPHGWADPRYGFSYASSLNPSLVVWITDDPDGHGMREIDRDILLDHLWRKLAPGRVEICTVLIGDAEGELMRTIARDQDGVFKRVTNADFGIE